MTLHYVNQMKNGVAELYLFGEIGYEINGGAFAREVQYLDGLEEIKEIHVHINSPGGSVVDGLSIFHSIKNAKTPTKTIVVGIAASMGGIISQAGDKREIMDYGKIMIHNPFNANGYDESQDEGLEAIKDILSSILESNAKIEKDSISDYMDKETWFDSQSAIEYGFADVVINSKRKLDKGKGVVQSENFTPYNKLVEMANNFKPKSKLKMKKVTNFLKLNEEANEDLVLSAIQDKAKALETKEAELLSVQNKLTEKDSELETLKAEKTALEVENKKMLDEKAVSIVKNAIEKGVFKQEDETSLIEECKKDIPAFENLISKVNVSSHANILGEIDNKSADNVPAEFKGKTLREIEKMGSTRIKNLENNHPALYKKMYKDEYGVEL